MIDARAAKLSDYSYPITKSSNWTAVIGYPRDLHAHTHTLHSIYSHCLGALNLEINDNDSNRSLQLALEQAPYTILGKKIGKESGRIRDLGN